MSSKDAINALSLPKKLAQKTSISAPKLLSNATLISKYNQILKNVGSQKILETLPPTSLTLDPAHLIQGNSYLEVYWGILTPISTPENAIKISGNGQIYLRTNSQTINPSDISTWESFLSVFFETTPGKTYALEFAVCDGDANGNWQFIGSVSATYPSEGAYHSLIVGFKARGQTSCINLFYQRKTGLSGSGLGTVFYIKMTEIG
jgi:hypothetical protein